MTAWLMQRWKRLVGTIGALASVLILLTPIAIWHLTPTERIDLLVVNKSIPRPDFDKHAGLFWLLDYERLRSPDGRQFDEARDFVGYSPRADGPGTDVPIPAATADLTYLSDAYGVYENDLAGTPGVVGSRRLAGGISPAEAQTILAGVRRGGTLVGEFNILSAPTDPAAADRLGRAFGVTASGWVGRHFEYLELTPDLPPWLPVLWQRQTGTRWQFTGPGYVFVSDNGSLVVLREGIDTATQGLRIRVDEAHADEFGTDRNQGFDSWVEIVAPRAGAEVVASFDLDLTASGRTKMLPVPISGRWPAIVRTVSAERTSYYFANDASNRPYRGRYGYKWMPQVNRRLGKGSRADTERYYWGIYVPIMQRVLHDVRRQVQARRGS